MSLTKPYNQVIANLALLQLAKVAIDLENSMFKASNVETPLATDYKEEKFSNPTFDGFVIHKKASADCLQEHTKFYEKQFNVLLDLMSETMKRLIWSGKIWKCSDSS